MGSSPIVSTTKVLVTALRLGEEPRRIGRRAHYVPAARAWADEPASARCDWDAVAGPTERQLLDALIDAEHTTTRLRAGRARQALDRASGRGIDVRIAVVDHELESIAAHAVPARLQRSHRPKSAMVWVCRCEPGTCLRPRSKRIWWVIRHCA
ncbi:MAG: hypothetical protein ACRD0W_24685, partial [Acidimicrobiales bacterium]